MAPQWWFAQWLQPLQPPQTASRRASVVPVPHEALPQHTTLPALVLALLRLTQPPVLQAMVWFAVSAVAPVVTYTALMLQDLVRTATPARLVGQLTRQQAQVALPAAVPAKVPAAAVPTLAAWVMTTPQGRVSISPPALARQAASTMKSSHDARLSWKASLRWGLEYVSRPRWGARYVV